MAQLRSDGVGIFFNEQHVLHGRDIAQFILG